MAYTEMKKNQVVSTLSQTKKEVKAKEYTTS